MSALFATSSAKSSTSTGMEKTKNEVPLPVMATERTGENNGWDRESNISTITFEEGHNVLGRFLPTTKLGCSLITLAALFVAGGVATASVCLAGFCSRETASVQSIQSQEVAKNTFSSDVSPSASPTTRTRIPTQFPVTAPPTLPREPITSLEELYAAVDDYLATNESYHPVYGAIEQWDISQVTSLSRVFDAFDRNALAETFDADLSRWDTSNIQSMERTFIGAAFNGDVSNWNVARVTTMESMFSDARAFDGDVSKWNTSKVVNMKETFARAVKFSGQLRFWDLSSVETTHGMFRLANRFNDDLRLWDVSKVVDMSSMFLNCFSFQGVGLGAWKTTSLSKMDSMFSNAPKFNGDISRWDVSNVVSMKKTFEKATSFNSDLSRWSTSKVTTMEALFRFAVSFNADIKAWNTGSVTNFADSFLGASGFLGEVSSWNVSQGRDFSHMFAGARFVKHNYCAWRRLLEGVQDVPMDGMFLATNCPSEHDPDLVANGPFCHVCEGTVFPPTLSPTFTFDHVGPFEAFTSTTELHDAVSTYLKSNSSPESYVATVYGWPMSCWDVSAITNFNITFDTKREPLAKGFNEPLLGWNTSRALSMGRMFRGAQKFDQSLGHFDTKSVTAMDEMFENAFSFRGEGLEQWDTSSVESMEGIFEGAISMNADVSEWKTGSLTNMARSFQFTSRWNSDISAWDVSSVTDFFYTFSGTAVFNRDLGLWNVSSANRLVGTFSGAKSFNKNLCLWRFQLPPDADIRGMFPGSGCFDTGDPIFGTNWMGPFCRDCVN